MLRSALFILTTLTAFVIGASGSATAAKHKSSGSSDVQSKAEARVRCCIKYCWILLSAAVLPVVDALERLLGVVPTLGGAGGATVAGVSVVVVRHVLRELRDGVDTRPMEMYDEDECDKD